MKVRLFKGAAPYTFASFCWMQDPFEIGWEISIVIFRREFGVKITTGVDRDPDYAERFAARVSAKKVNT